MNYCIYRYDIECDCYPNCKGCPIDYHDWDEFEEEEDGDG